MTPITRFEKDAIKKSADTIGSMMDSHRDALITFADQWPGLGSVPSAQPLDQIVSDRRAAVVGQANRLETAFQTMQTALTTLADDLADTDQANAQAVGELDSLKSDVKDSLSIQTANDSSTS